MRQLIRLLCGVLALAAIATSAHAQPFLVGTQTARVGACYDGVANRTYDLLEVRRFYSNQYSDKVAALGAPSPFPGGPPEIVNAMPDPSGIHLLAVQSALNGVQFWIARNGAFVSISQAGARQFGTCNFHPMFAAQFPMPQPVTWTNNATYTFGFAPQNVGTPGTFGAPRTLPAKLFEEGLYVGQPLLVAPALASTCLNSAAGDSSAFYRCVLGSTLGQRERAALECSQSSSSPQEATLCLLAQNMGGNERANLEKVRQCYAQYGERWDEYPLCLAGDQVDPNVMNLVSCARTHLQSGRQPDYWTLGYCAVGDKLLAGLNPNAESSVAINCAIATQGNPKAFAICTGGTLLANELDKCLTDGVGDNGCFGKNNTLTQAYERVDEELAAALGKSNPAYTAWRAARLASDPAAMARAVKDVDRELNRAADNISKEAARAAERAGNLVADVMPRVTIGKKCAKVWGKKMCL